MAWPKLRNKSSGPLMTASNRSGAAHDGARRQGKAPEGASGDAAREPVRGTEGADGTERVQDAPVTWPGQGQAINGLASFVRPPSLSRAARAPG